MKIVLIEAGEHRLINVFRAKLPREGLPIIGRILKDLGHEVVIYCEDIAPINWQDVFSADLVGISALTPTASRAYEIAARIKEKRIPIVGGGPHFTFLPEESLSNGFDFVVRGEGEETIVELVKWLEKPEPNSITKIFGLSYRIGKNFFHNPSRLPIENLDSIPFPKWSLIEGFKIRGTIPISTSRGCPYDCTFCSVTKMFGKKYRFRSKDKVIKEIEKLHRQFPKAGVFFTDDNFAANPKRTKALLREMITQKLTPQWSCQVRVEVAKNLELLGLMRDSGCEWHFWGLESINPQTLINFNKKQTVEDIEKGIKIIKSFGINGVGMFVIGGDGDDLGTAKRTVEFAKRNKIDVIIPWILTPLPGTPIYNQLEKEGRLLFKEKGVKKWRYYDGSRVVFRPKNMKPRELRISVNKAALKFYSVWNGISKFWEAVGKFLSPHHSFKEKRIGFDNFKRAIYLRLVAWKAQKSLKKHLTDLEGES